MNSKTQRTVEQQKYNGARSNLLLMLILTTVNTVLFLSGSGTMFLFSATVPYLMAIFGMAYADMPVIMLIFLAIAAVSLVLYLLCWIFSKKHFGWMIGALVLFVLDIVFMAGMYLSSPDLFSILDALCHIWVLYYLILGVSSGVKLSKMPAEESIPVDATEAELDGETGESATAAPEDTRALRRMDTEVKARILLEADAVGRHIVYRRVKRTNELVIGSYVYDEAEMLVEKAHELSAYIDGHKIAVGLDNTNRSYLAVDDVVVEQKIRWI